MQFISLYYSFGESCIISANIEDKILSITSIDNIYQSSMVDVSEDMKAMPQYTSARVCGNFNEAMQVLIPKIRMFDIDGENLLESDSLDEIWKSLNAEKKVKNLVANFNDSIVTQKALKILVKNCIHFLYKSSGNIALGATIKDRNPQNNQYFRRYRNA